MLPIVLSSGRQQWRARPKVPGPVVAAQPSHLSGHHRAQQIFGLPNVGGDRETVVSILMAHCDNSPAIVAEAGAAHFGVHLDVPQPGAAPRNPTP